MRCNYKNWPYKWFGFWKEYGLQYQNYPSIKDFVDIDRNSKYNKDVLIQYLQSGAIVAVTSGLSFPSPFTGATPLGSIAMRTDGQWIWLDTISDFIKDHNVVIPESWYIEIEQRNYCVPNISDTQIQLLLKNIEEPPL